MTSPLTPEAVAQMVADREAGTPGPWHFDGPVWNQIVWTGSDNRLCFMAHSNGLNDDRDIANARRIARLPDLESAYLTLAAENATLLDARDFWERCAVTNEKRWEKAEAELATLRASEAAALERADKLAGALEHMQWCRTCAEGSWKDCDDGLAALDLIEPLTPTADKEPKT